jgi:hypothetical protein
VSKSSSADACVRHRTEYETSSEDVYQKREVGREGKRERERREEDGQSAFDPKTTIF